LKSPINTQIVNQFKDVDVSNNMDFGNRPVSGPATQTFVSYDEEEEEDYQLQKLDSLIKARASAATVQEARSIKISVKSSSFG